MEEAKNGDRSEFGAGIVVCLAKFSQHLDIQSPRHPLNNDYRRSPENISSLIVNWMNAASDHLYDIDEDKAPDSLKELARLCLKVGHGFSNTIYDESTIEQIEALWQQACIDVDKMLGTNPIWGEW